MPTDIRERRRLGAGHNIPAAINADPVANARYFQQEITGQDIYATLGEVTPSQPANALEATQFAATGNAFPTQISPHDFYTFHLGDIFFPGGPAYVLDQKFETPLMAIWGNGLLLAPNRGFQAYPPIPPIYHPTLPRMATSWGAIGAYPWGVGVLPGSYGVDQSKQVSVNLPADQINQAWSPDPNVYFDPVMGDY